MEQTSIYSYGRLRPKSSVEVWMDELDGMPRGDDPLAGVGSFLAEFKRRPSASNNHVTFHRAKTTVTIHRKVIDRYTRMGMSIDHATECALMARMCPGCFREARSRRRPGLCETCDAEYVGDLVDLVERLEP